MVIVCADKDIPRTVADGELIASVATHVGAGCLRVAITGGIQIKCGNCSYQASNVQTVLQSFDHHFAWSWRPVFGRCHDHLEP